MSIAVDHSRLRRITGILLPAASIEETEAAVILELVQLAAGADDADDPATHAVMMTIAQHVGSLAGIEARDLLPIPRVADEQARRHWLRALAAHVTTPGARDLTYVLVFIVSVGDLVLRPAERAALEELQHALELDHRRATDLVVLLTDVLATAA